MSEEKTDISARPGLILKAAREELKLSLDQVAYELHLRSSVVQSIEDESYDDFSSDVFLKGYFRSYCRLVNLHEERMVELLEKQLSCRQQAIEKGALVAKKVEQARVRKKAFTVLVVLGVVMLLSAYVINYLIGGSGDDMPATLAAQPAVELSGEPNDDRAESEADMLAKKGVADKNISGKSEAEPSNAPVQVSSKPSGSPITAEAPVSAEALVGAEAPVTAEMPKQVADGLTQKTKLAQNTGDKKVEILVEAEFKAEFAGDCWFKFTNGAGRTVFAALKRAGQEVNYKGQAPFTVVIGDASQAKVTFNGQQVNLKPHTAKNGRAQLKLVAQNAE